MYMVSYFIASAVCTVRNYSITSFAAMGQVTSVHVHFCSPNLPSQKQRASGNHGTTAHAWLPKKHVLGVSAQVAPACGATLLRLRQGLRLVPTNNALISLYSQVPVSGMHAPSWHMNPCAHLMVAHASRVVLSFTHAPSWQMNPCAHLTVAHASRVIIVSDTQTGTLGHTRALQFSGVTSQTSPLPGQVYPSHTLGRGRSWHCLRCQLHR